MNQKLEKLRKSVELSPPELQLKLQNKILLEILLELKKSKY